jgi:ketosteroid isomerase-like protein
VERRFTSGELTVLEVVYRTAGDGAALGLAAVRLELEVPAVTVIRVRDGRVVEHRDYVDYPSLMRQVERQTPGAPR